MAHGEEKELAHAEYWDGHYSQANGEESVCEWYRSYSDLEPFFQKNFFGKPGWRPEDNPSILHLGSGDSVIPAEFASRDYRRQLCTDFSTTVVKLMTVRHEKVEGIEWKWMDVRDMAGIADKSVDVAFDKGTLDAMIHGSPWSPPDDVKQSTSKYLEEIHRVLKDDGVFLYVSFRRPHFLEILIKPSGLWTIDIQVLQSDNSFHYSGLVIKKKKL